MTDARQPRFDRGPRVRISMDAPTPDFAPAVKTKEGYLVVRAWIARDGLLEYSDGAKTWIEYRPRSELVAAADSFAGVPVTDEHPAEMVTAETHSDVCRGIVLDGVRVTEPMPEHGGWSFLEATLSIRDADLIERIESGEQDECSIGFTAVITPTERGFAKDGTACDAVQSELAGNHNAQVTEGRAGPICKVYLDGAQVLVPSMTRINMTTKKDTGAPPVKKDEAGAPTETLPFQLPDGTEVQLPSVVVSMLQELAQLKAVQAPVPPAPQPAAPAPVGLDSGEEEKEKSMDAKTYARRRAKLERLAVKWGVEESKLDSEDDALGRELVSKAMPHLEGKLDSVKGERLDALVEAAALTPVPEPEARGDALDELSGLYTQPRSDSKLDKDERDRIAYLRKEGFLA